MSWVLLLVATGAVPFFPPPGWAEWGKIKVTSKLFILCVWIPPMGLTGNKNGLKRLPSRPNGLGMGL